MSMDLLAIDLGKQSFHLHGIDHDGVVVSQKVSRARLVGTVNKMAPKMIAMEACASAHHWGRWFMSDGVQVRLINPRFVKPFVRGSKNDAIDAEAIYEAATRPTMRFVPVKSVAQQDLQSLHRVRERLIVQRTSLINHARGLLAEYGIVLPQGPWRFAAQAPEAIVPRQYTTGGKPRLGGIGRRANHYLRRQMIHGARAVISRLAKHGDRRSVWLKALVARRGFNKALVALANKTARVAWALLTRKESYVSS